MRCRKFESCRGHEPIFRGDSGERQRGHSKLPRADPEGGNGKSRPGQAAGRNSNGEGGGLIRVPPIGTGGRGDIWSGRQRLPPVVSMAGSLVLTQIGGTYATG